jgi:hypothetical protein
VFTPDERVRLREAIVAAAREDPRISGGALTGSAAASAEDRWSDIDLAFGLKPGTDMQAVLADFSKRMYELHDALDHVDVPFARWIYRVFLMRSSLQVDLAFVPDDDFRARAPSFRLLFGSSRDAQHAPPPDARQLIGYGWLYALHARSSIARGKLWQAEYMVSQVRDHVLALACVRLGLPAREGRGMDRLPRDVTDRVAGALVQRIDAQELRRAAHVAIEALIDEIRHVDVSLAGRLDDPLRELG